MNGPKKRYTIGLIAPTRTNAIASYTDQICTTILKASKKHDINVVIFYGYALNRVTGVNFNPFDNYSRKESALFSSRGFVNTNNFDGVIIITNNLFFFLDEQQVQSYFEHISPIPTISFGLEMKNVPSIVIDNKKGMRELVKHLIYKHGYTKIAFIKGPEVNIEANCRYQTYLETLEECNIPFNPDIVVEGNFTGESGAAGVGMLLDKRGAQFDALITANDDTALGALAELGRRNIKVPFDLGLAGFDNAKEAFFSLPTLTTVEQPLEKMCEIAILNLVKTIEGKKVPLLTSLDTSIVIRNSCGCLSGIIADISSKKETRINRGPSYFQKLVTERINTSFSSDFCSQNTELISRFVSRLFQENIKETTILTTENIFSTFYRLLISTLENDNELHPWHDIITLIENYYREEGMRPDQGIFISRIRTVLTVFSEAAQGKIKNDFYNNDILLFHISQKLVNHVNLKNLYQSIFEELPRLGITSCYIFLFRQNVPDLSCNKKTGPLELVFGFDEKRMVPENEKKTVGKMLIPGKVRKGEKKVNFIVTTILFREELFGYIVLSIKRMNGIMYDTLSQQIGNAIKNTRLFREREKAELQLKKANNRLVTTNEKLKEMDRIKTNFFANISHELRTPLTLILGPLESLYEGEYGQSVDNQNKIIKSALSNGWRLLKLINNLLDFAKLDEGGLKVNREETDLARLIEYYISIVGEGAAHKGLRIEFLPEDGDFTFRTDRDLIEKIFFNLISNSFKFTPAGGTITVSLEAGEQALSLMVADTGIGIPEDKQESIFERFIQVDGSSSRKYEGTGIGLAFTKEMTELLGGSIKAESTPGKGSLFTITFPRDKNNGEAAGKKGAGERRGIGNPGDSTNRKGEGIGGMNEVKSYLLSELNMETGENEGAETIKTSCEGREVILVIDDSPSMRTFLTSILEKKYAVITAENGRTGLEKTKHHLPDLVISDVMMPEIDGIEFTYRLKNAENLKHIPVLLLTARGDIAARIEGLKTKADDYLTKPFNARELMLRVKNLLSNRELQTKIAKQHQVILTGLNYARIIQGSILPDVSIIKKKVNDFFILWKPKDIVGGDFYWFKEIPGGFLTAVIDCTGHGIPGAFMTMGTYSELNHITDRLIANDPAVILETLNNSLKNNLKQENESSSHSKSDEGLDMALCFYNTEEKRLFFAGARRPLYYVQDNKLKCINGDKQSIGYRRTPFDYSFSTHRIDCSGGITFYLTSDGFSDQIDGDDRDVFGTANLKKLLLEIHNKPMKEQKMLLEKAHQTYRGSNIQIDDITIVGFRI